MQCCLGHTAAGAMEPSVAGRKERPRPREPPSRLEKAKQKSAQQELKQRQRAEIYALNRVMTELEQQQFDSFCKQMQASGDTGGCIPACCRVGIAWGRPDWGWVPEQLRPLSANSGRPCAEQALGVPIPCQRERSCPRGVWIWPRGGICIQLLQLLTPQEPLRGPRVFLSTARCKAWIWRGERREMSVESEQEGFTRR
ncbi:small vasohibin-binding protein isoform X1 [Cuculus canorus]|uniref:small vasohibin-binding protein isoform X1 n=1 Tax=Cuculus canorus TaxID=55661 RepID=UPI0023AAAC9D|nr:small vasohibin-binding protein isoform X1 [Cuculus canorus]